MNKAEKGGIRPAHKASLKNRTSVTVLARKAWDAGQTVVRPHSLKIEARAEWTLSKASRLSMVDRLTAGAAARGAQDKGAGFFPLPFFVDAMSLGKGKSSSRIGGGGWSSEKKER